MFRCCARGRGGAGAARRRPLSRRHVRRRRLQRGACWRRRLRRCWGIDRDPDAIAAGRGLAAALSRGRLNLLEGRFGDMVALLRAAASAASTAWRSISASPRCSSTRPSAASRSAPTVRSTCAWTAAGQSAADLVNEADEASSPTSSARYGEERQRRRVARAIVEARKRKRIEPHRRAGRDRAPCRRAEGQGRERSRRPAPSRRCASP